ncbi:hypothetical protein [Anaerovibrio sp. RM50]|uniref:hypothetical protein n=1 Tax=Anaerovibrio sp. RM50 TaxID=1200557 RepID=UPI000480A253|nr:hypothetical protein [Anaerovibrio sp. RM50]
MEKKDKALDVFASVEDVHVARGIKPILGSDYFKGIAEKRKKNDTQFVSIKSIFDDADKEDANSSR